MRWLRACLGVIVLLFCALPLSAADGRVYVVLWFDTEDYILPASDDAALYVADFLSREQIRGTFKVVGEKARTLERRARHDVIAALKKHEIGYHSNFHSVQPTPAQYLAPLGWDEGIAEFDRREKPGYDDVRRIFGQDPSCYGQPGSSWGPQSYGAMRQWGMKVYLDAGRHVQLDDKPHYYCGILNLYKLRHQIRCGIKTASELPAGQDEFASARQKLLAEGGGVVSIIYHPCEFVHRQFWDGVNFKAGANPPREQWIQPPVRTPEEAKVARDNFEAYIRFMKRFPDVRFVTAGDALSLYKDRLTEKSFTDAEVRAIAGAVGDKITYQRSGAVALTPGEIFGLLNRYVASRNAGEAVRAHVADRAPLGPDAAATARIEPIRCDRSQFLRTVQDVESHLKRFERIPAVVWLGSVGIPPEMYLRGLAQFIASETEAGVESGPIEFSPARLAAADHVSEDDPRLWGWVIFPPGFRAPAMMQLAKRQAWTLKPALLQPTNDK